MQCDILESKKNTARVLSELAVKKNNEGKKTNLIWLEATGCSGNIISLLNAYDPDVVYLLTEMVDMRYNNSLMAAQGDFAYKQFLDTLNTEFILAVDGAIATKDNGMYNIIATYNGKKVTALEAVKLAGSKAKYVLAVGTCASYGGISAASPNPAECKSVQEVVDREVIKLPGCPCHPDWVIGTIAQLILFGKPELDQDNRPITFYGNTIHDRCNRRAYFNKGIFAKELGEKGCMFKLGCRGPVTRTDCPIRKWNDSVNWPIGDNTPCIGCANFAFPDGMEPFIKY